MEIFEFYFQPQSRKDIVLKSFYLAPKNLYGEKLGSLFFLGTLKKVSNQKEEVLEKLKVLLERNYYRKLANTQLVNFKENLKLINDFLKKEIEQKNYLWGNLNLGMLTIKNLNFLFSKIGNIKIFLIRGKNFFDVQEKIKNKKIKISFSGFFSSIICGRLMKNDVIFVLSDEIEDFFAKEKIFSEILKGLPFDQLKFRKILNQKKEKLKNEAGICMILNLIESEKEKKIVQPNFLEQIYFSLPSLSTIFDFLTERKNFILIFLFIFLIFLGLILFP